MKKILIYFGIILSYCLVSCSGNDDIETIRPWTEEYVLPQGKSDADDRIVDYYEKFGTYILYEYSYLDFRYEFPSYAETSYECPDPAVVGDAVSLLEDIWFNFYPAEFHKKYMPLKIMLSKYLDQEDYYGDITSHFLIIGTACLAVGHCTDALKNLDAETKLAYKNELQRRMWQTWVTKIEFPEEFFTISDYTRAAVTDVNSDDYARKRGFVANLTSGTPSEWSLSMSWTTKRLDDQTDLRSYIIGMALRTSEEWASDLEYPLVKQKYDLLRSWIQETFGFDLQNVGDTTYE